jgi:hypothetical protein
MTGSLSQILLCNLVFLRYHLRPTLIRGGTTLPAFRREVSIQEGKDRRFCMFQGTRCQAWALLCIAALCLMPTVPAPGQIQITRTSVCDNVSLVVSDLPTIRPDRQDGPARSRACASPAASTTAVSYFLLLFRGPQRSPSRKKIVHLNTKEQKNVPIVPRSSVVAVSFSDFRSPARSGAGFTIR